MFMRLIIWLTSDTRQVMGSNLTRLSQIFQTRKKNEKILKLTWDEAPKTN